MMMREGAACHGMVYLILIRRCWFCGSDDGDSVEQRVKTANVKTARNVVATVG
jgi:hypothetical protein